MTGFARPFSFLRQAFGKTRRPGGKPRPYKGRVGFAEISFVAASCFDRDMPLPT
jgi:hypothetical protein